jgi:hypothetical protein
LPSSCPVCEHSPVSADDCTVYKSLRTTIRVFLKTEEKKREAARPKTNGSAPPTPVEAAPAPAASLPKGSGDAPPTEANLIPKSNGVIGDAAVDGPTTAEAPPQDSTVTNQAGSAPTHLEKVGRPRGVTSQDLQALTGFQDGPAPDQPGDQRDADESEQALIPGGQDDAEVQQSEDADEDADGQELAEDEEGYGPDSAMNGNFNGMNFGGGDMNPMQMQMMMMQNGMNPAAFSGFPMMGKLPPNQTLLSDTRSK